MATPLFPKPQFLIFSLVSVAIFSSYVCTGYAEDNPAQTVAKALLCFNNRFIYSGCDEAYRLSESGNLNVPFGATDLFCKGPCLAETQLVLNCVDNVFSDFVFYNKATVRDLRNALRFGCSYTNQRGNFFIQREISSAHKLCNLISFYALALIAGCCFFIL